MEDLARRRGLADLHVVVSGQLHEALQARRAVLGALPFVAVRQHQRQAVDAAPLHFAARDELVDDDLRTVDEVAELRFPDDQRVRLGGSVAVLEAQDGLFGQQRIDDAELRLAIGHVLQRNVGAGVPLLAVLVVQHRVAVRERAAAAVFAGQANGIAAGHQRGIGHGLAHAPVDVDLAAAHRGAVGQHFLDERVDLEVLRHRGHALGQALDLGQRERGVGGIRPLLAQEGRPVDGVLALEVGQHRVDGVAAFVHRGAVGLDHGVRAIGRQHALRHQLVAVQAAGARVLGDLLVHQRLGQAGRVLLVVAQLAEADDVDHDVLAELLAVVHGDLGALHHRLGVVPVHVQHGCIDHLHDVGAIQGRAAIARVAGGEADLVVDDQVHGAASAVATRLRQGQRLHDHALAREGGVAVHQHRQHLRARGVAAALHARLDRALDDRVHDLEVRRVEGQAQVNRAAAGGDVAGEALVVLHVAGRKVFLGGVVELREQVLGHLAEGVHEHVQAAAVGHADHDFLDAMGARALDDLVHRGDEALAALEREALLADVLGVEIALQALAGRQAVEDVLLLVSGEAGLAAHALQPFLPPALFHRLGDVHDLGADRPAVGLAQSLQDLPQGHVLGLAEVRVRRTERDVHVGLGQVVERGLQLGDLGALGALEGVQVGPAGAERTVGGDERLHVQLLARDGEVVAGGLDDEAAGLGALRERFDDRCVRDIPRLGTIDRRHMLQVVEVGPPVVGHAAWVVEVGLIEFLDIRRIAAEQVRVGPVLVHHLSLTFRPGSARTPMG